MVNSIHAYFVQWKRKDEINPRFYTTALPFKTEDAVKQAITTYKRNAPHLEYRFVFRPI